MLGRLLRRPVLDNWPDTGPGARTRKGAAGELGLPDYDYWLFDDDRLVRMYFNDGGRMEKAEIITDPAAVEAHQRHRGVAWAEAVPYAQYAAAHPPGGW